MFTGACKKITGNGLAAGYFLQCTLIRIFIFDFVDACYTIFNTHAKIFTEEKGGTIPGNVICHS